MAMERSAALAVGAHPDDVEFMMAGTLLMLAAAGLDIHVWSIANGCCGALSANGDETAKTREKEARSSAAVGGARWHPPLVDDLSIMFDASLVSRVASVLRDVKPAVLLVPSPDDYMEDHQNACRVTVTAAFALSMPAFEADPPAPAWDGDVTIYHAMPYGLRDGMRRLVRPGSYVDVEGELPTKKEMLAQHRSQFEFLQASQGLGSYVGAMEEMCEAVGAMSGGYRYAEGWRRHSHLGYSREDIDPLKEFLGDSYMIDAGYEESLG
jgi:LmbE family N-acetylglucosaminyl deacetylase